MKYTQIVKYTQIHHQLYWKKIVKYTQIKKKL